MSKTKNKGSKPQPQPNDNAKAVAEDLTKLTPEEKTVVAGLLAKLLKGARLLKSGRVFFYFYYG
ncbi:hypothetical protein ANAPC1_00838 [Anaplasma phagocytophilum]|uniref:Uncharacterized protein n=1 Tax=Anaplasma phagocytophilum TaxID=948 RepID=A0AA45UTN1_ANAPH|nr:hypothetical protein [Anaplasma phagocytophilum]SBO14480.1 hypothetical protein ANAPC1_00838 [Anaplasma phagocytophilum]SBO29813.1 hypothetical protein ANAPC2_00002 [Anaplasma phagocytophilum]SBO31849.1 hypothetical protein ANAPC3_00663 [Anaplasma phagocytophilum]SBO32087.1 hypothetical protein ANAPC4_00690 [Anaplasma phagocytophilum]SCV63498.1 hypothetical protein ANAPC5_00588 [Anaplasma phagocytophilum]